MANSNDQTIICTQINPRIELRTTDPCVDDSRKLAGLAGMPCRMKGSFERMLKLAFEMHKAGRTQDAEDMCRVLMQVRPDNAQLLFLLGMILHDAEQDEEAVRWLSLAAQYQPQTARIFKGLGCAYQRLKDHERAVNAFERALELEPKSGATCYNLANNCYPLGQIERAAALYQKAVEIDPRDSGSWNNLGKCLRELNQPDKSIEAYNRAVELAPGYAMARYGRSMSLLTAGRLAEGFRDYEARWYAMKARTFPQPVWRGENAPGKTLFLHAEQGYGDAIQMIRLIPAARERVGRVILECRPELTTLFRFSKCADEVISYGDPIPPFDFFTPLSSLPLALGITLDSIPSRTPYLRVPTGEPPSLAQSGHLKVGLVWAGSSTHHQDAARSIQLKDLTPILRVPDVDFYSLQQPVPARDESCLRTNHGIINSNFVIRDFLDTASIVAQLDLVITVDTAVAHLAGALGKPVWLLLQHSPDWRWFLKRADTPWYPTMQLFRQMERSNWELPVLRVAEALRRMADSHCTCGHRCSHACSVEKPRNGSRRLMPIVSLAPLSR
jgi:Flp pilus assembly protein TadD